jgi:radical SAM superfamily enzyme YgiQ (UPF0313 family)
MRKIKLLLISPVYAPYGLGRDRGSKMPPLSLACLAACTPAHYDVRIIDEFIEPLEFESADIVGITAYTSHIVRAYEIAQQYRNAGIPVVMGGIHASMLPEEALNYCDTVVVGEAEDLWPRVLMDFERGRLKSIYKGSLPDIDTIPAPRRDLFAGKPYVWGNIQTSRGCPMSCSFCSVTRFNGRKFRRRSIDAVMDELSQIESKYLFFVDDNLLGFGDKDWLYDFFERIVRRNLKKLMFAQTSIKFGEDRELIHLARRAGMRLIFVGMESINYSSLKAYNKNLNADYVKENRVIELINNIRKGGIAFMGGFLLGGDQDRVEDFKATLDFLHASRIDVLQMTKPTPLPGTRFFDKLYSAGRIINNNYPRDWKDYRFTRMVFKPENMTIQEVYHGFHWLKKEFYRLPVKIRRHFRTLLDTKSMSATLLAYIMNRSYENHFRDSKLYQEFEKNDNIFSRISTCL